MFRAPPEKHTEPFGVGLFAMALIYDVAGHIVHGYSSLGLFFASTVVLFGYAIVAASAFWLGLGFNHRSPAPLKSAFLATVVYTLVHNLLSLIGVTRMPLLVAHFVLLAALSFVLGIFLPAHMANNSLKRTAADELP